jgi:hypothetical protein
MRPSLALLILAGVVVAASLSTVARAQPAPPPPAQIVKLGHVEVWSVPDQLPASPPDPATVKGGPAVSVFRSRSVSLAEARALVDFPLVTPSSLPAGFVLAEVQVLELSSAVQASLVYRDAATDPRTTGSRELIVHQRRWTGVARIMIPRSLEEGSVGGQPAAFDIVALPAPAPLLSAAMRIAVFFELGELLIHIDSASLDRDMLIRVAESLVEET